MQLTKNQKETFYKKGYLKISQVIPQKMINLALRTINHHLGKGMDPKKMDEYRADSYLPKLRKHTAISDLLYKSSLFPVCQSIVERGKLQLWGDGQIALRFPGMEVPGAYHPHIDGLYSPGNRIGRNTIHSFTLLAGVLLSDTPNQYWGNFTAWPGTHHLLQDYFLEHGTKSLPGGLPPIKLPEPEQITGKAGDVILAHYQTAHTAAINVSPFIRYAVFFRLIHSNHRRHGDKVFTNIWLEYPDLLSAIG